MNRGHAWRNTIATNDGARAASLGRDARPVAILVGTQTPARRAMTLIEVLVSVGLMSVIMLFLVWIVAGVGETIAESRAVLEMTNNLRSASSRLQEDLSLLTVTTDPPRRPEQGEGYLEIIEGPLTSQMLNEAFTNPGANPAIVVDSNGDPDSTVMDVDDIVMFTARAQDAPFLGLINGAADESYDAEIVWFVRGTTLYRRVLLVRPDLDLGPSGLAAAPAGFFADYDVSVRRDASGNLVANSLGDLTKRENRFAHQYGSSGAFPFNPHATAGWGTDLASGSRPILGLGMPTLQECSSTEWHAGYRDAALSDGQGVEWIAGRPLPAVTDAAGAVRPDLWVSPHPWEVVQDSQTGAIERFNDGVRIGEDVMLNNVIGFDVRVWDAVAGDYVDMGGGDGGVFNDDGTQANLPRVYDTWSFHYEHDGVDQDGDGVTDEGTNGFDDGGEAGVVDDPGELEAPPPYDVPLRGIEVIIRTFDPDSSQVRQTTIVKEFLPK